MNLPQPYATLLQHVDQLHWLLRDHAAPPVTWVAAVKTEWEAIAALHVRCFGGSLPAFTDCRPGDWVAVIDDSHCTVRLGGPGALWRMEADAGGGNVRLYGVSSPYGRAMFRRATAEEIAAHRASKASP